MTTIRWLFVTGTWCPSAGDEGCHKQVQTVMAVMSRVGFTHAGNAPSWERLDAHACGVCGMYLFGCSSEAPNHVRRTLVSTRPDACAPRKHRCDLPQVATLRHRGSGVARLTTTETYRRVMSVLSVRVSNKLIRSRLRTMYSMLSS